MALYPAMLELSGRLAVVVGAGPVGLRKARGLLEAGARVRLIAPEKAARLEHPALEWLQRPYRAGDLDGACLVFAATDDAELNARIAADAGRLGVWINVAGQPGVGNLFVPAVRRQDPLTLAVSTDGGSPAAAALAADRAAECLGLGWQRFAVVAAALRRLSLTEKRSATYNRSVLRTLLEDGLVELLESGDRQAVDALLRRHCGVEGLAALKISRADLPL